MKRLRKALTWLLCAVMLAGAVACTVEKSASGQKSAGSETQQEKSVVTHGKNREKAVPAAEFATDKVVVENNSLSLIARGCAVAAPCRSKVAEQLLEIGAKAGIVGLAGVVIKDVADKMTSDELDHLITLEMMGNDEITGNYLSSLQDKYGTGEASNPNIGKDLTDAEKVELGGAGSGTPGGWEPQDEENARNNEASSQQNEVNFDAAKDRYPKQYDQYNKLPDKNLEKAISKHNKQIAEHQGYLNDPVKRLEHVPDWENLSSQHQENLLHHWQQDINRHEAYKAIAEGILKGRNNGI